MALEGLLIARTGRGYDGLPMIDQTEVVVKAAMMAQMMIEERDATTGRHLADFLGVKAAGM